MYVEQQSNYLKLVAPRRGAWIEIGVMALLGMVVFLSLPAGERGLKYLKIFEITIDSISRSPQGSVD